MRSDLRELCCQQCQSGCRPARGRVCTTRMMLKWFRERGSCLDAALHPVAQQPIVAVAPSEGNEPLRETWQIESDARWFCVRQIMYLPPIERRGKKNNVSSQHWFQRCFPKDHWLSANIFDFFFYFYFFEDVWLYILHVFITWVIQSRRIIVSVFCVVSCLLPEPLSPCGLLMNQFPVCCNFWRHKPA